MNVVTYFLLMSSQPEYEEKEKAADKLHCHCMHRDALHLRPNERAAMWNQQKIIHKG